MRHPKLHVYARIAAPSLLFDYIGFSLLLRILLRGNGGELCFFPKGYLERLSALVSLLGGLGGPGRERRWRTLPGPGILEAVGAAKHAIQGCNEQPAQIAGIGCYV